MDAQSVHDALLSVIEKDIPNRKAENTQAENRVKSLSTEDFDTLDTKINRHTKFNVNVLWVFTLVIIVLSTCLINGYLRLADMITDQGDSLILRMDKDRENLSQRLDQFQQFNITRMDGISSLSQPKETQLLNTPNAKKRTRN